MAKEVKLPEKTIVPANWTWIELGKFTETKSGYPFDSGRFSLDSDGKKPLIRIRDIVRGYTETFTDEDCPEDYVIHRGEILIGMDGDFNLEKWANEDALLNQRVCTIKSKSPCILDDFIYYHLPSLLKAVNEATPSVTVKHLSTKTIGKIPFPIPPLSEQHRIVDRIESLFAKLDEAKEKAQAVVDGYEQCKAAILHQAFSGEFTVLWREKHNIKLDSWRDAELNDVVSGFKYGSSEKSDYNNCGIPVFRIPNVTDDGLSFEDMKYLTHTDIPEESQIHENDILIIRSNGSRDLVGKSVLVPKLDKEYAYASFLIRIKPSPIINPKYLTMFLNSSDARSQMFKKAKSSAGINNINTKELGAISLLIPSVEEQIEIVAVIDKLLLGEQQAKESAELVVEQIETMKKSILARAFRGELGTNNPTDESTEELLKQTL